MAESSDVSQVRLNTDEPTEEHWSDEAIGALIDSLGVDGASARIWHSKAARFSALVDVSEAGASRKMSQMFTNAQAMVGFYEARSVAPPETASGPRVHKIVRE